MNWVLSAGDIYAYDHHSFVFKRKVLNNVSGRAIIDERQVLLYRVPHSLPNTAFL